MKIIPYIVALIILDGCDESKRNSMIDTVNENQLFSKKMNDDWVIKNSKIDLDRTNIHTNSILTSNFFNPIEGERVETYPDIVYDSLNNSTLVLEFYWTPKNLNTVCTMTNKSNDIDYMFYRTIFIEILDKSKIVNNIDYYIPNENIKVKGVCFGILSNFEMYKNLNGKIRFKELSDLNASFKIVLVGELNEMIKFNYDTILNEEIYVKKETKKVFNDSNVIFK